MPITSSHVDFDLKLAEFKINGYTVFEDMIPLETIDRIRAAFLTLLGVTLLFATDTHHLFLAGLAGSYELIAPVRPLITADFVELAVRTLADSFMLGIQLAAPVIVFAIIFNLASGLVGRVMPSFQVFFATAPLSILLGLSIFTLSLGVVGTIFIDRYRSLAQIFAGGAGG